MMPSTKITQMILLYQKSVTRALDKKCQTSEPMVQIQNNFTEMFLMIPSTKIAQKGLAPLNKGATRVLDKTYL